MAPTSSGAPPKRFGAPPAVAASPRGVVVRIVKRVPMQSGLGGGSSDAAAAIRGLTALWRADVSPERQRQMAAANWRRTCRFSSKGEPRSGVDRGDLLFPLVDQPTTWVDVGGPAVWREHKDAYGWLDAAAPPGQGARAARLALFQPAPAAIGELVNDLEAPVAAVILRLPESGRTAASWGAVHAAMSGSGSAVFGLFESRPRRIERLARSRTPEHRALVDPQRRTLPNIGALSRCGHVSPWRLAAKRPIGYT